MPGLAEVVRKGGGRGEEGGCWFWFLVREKGVGRKEGGIGIWDSYLVRGEMGDGGRGLGGG